METAEVVKDLPSPRGEVHRLDARLREELQPRLAKASQLAEELRSKAAKIQQTLADLADARRQAAELFGKLSRSQVSEIKQLARNPPDSIRRTLIAAWLLLHSENFKGRSTVKFDESKDWPRLQRMLGEESFVTSVLSFDASRLSAVPQVPCYVATTYLGFRCTLDKSLDDDAILEALPSASNTGAATLSGAPPQFPTLDGQSMSKPLSSRSASTSSVQPVKGLRASSSTARLRHSVSQLKPPLEVEMVARASEPCGYLLQWIQRLVAETIEYRRLQAQLAPAEAELQAAERRQRAAESEAAEAECALAAAKLRVAGERVLEESPRRPDAEMQLRSARHSSVVLAAVACPPAIGQLPAVTSPTPTPRLPGSTRTPRKPALAARNLPPVHSAMEAVQRIPFASLKAVKQEAKLSAPACKIELDVTGSLTSVRQRLARLGIPFARNKSDVAESDSSQSQALSKIRVLLGEHRGRLKLRLQGHCDPGERHGADSERGLAVAKWLQDSAGTPAGWLRVEGLASTADLGRCVVPLAIQELVPLYGPICAEVASFSAPVGLYFESRESKITQETGAILSEMARWLSAEGANACVEGHCDKAEPPDIAMERAHAVRNALVKLGVCPRHLRTQSRTATCTLSRHAAPNRRAELHLD